MSLQLVLLGYNKLSKQLLPDAYKKKHKLKFTISGSNEKETVGWLKQKISNELPLKSVEDIRLVNSGKILDDDMISLSKLFPEGSTSLSILMDSLAGLVEQSTLDIFTLKQKDESDYERDDAVSVTKLLRDVKKHTQRAEKAAKVISL